MKLSQLELEIAERLATEYEARTGQYPDVGDWFDEILPEAERLAAAR